MPTQLPAWLLRIAWGGLVVLLGGLMGCQSQTAPVETAATRTEAASPPTDKPESEPSPLAESEGTDPPKVDDAAMDDDDDPDAGAPGRKARKGRVGKKKPAAKVQKAKPPKGKPQPESLEPQQAKQLRPNQPKPEAYASQAPNFEDVPLLKFDGQTSLPAFLQSPTAVISDGTGLKDNSLVRTVAHDLNEKDFVADVEFCFAPNEKTIFQVGIGVGGEAILSRVHGPGFGGYATLSIPAQGESEMGKFVTAGPHLFRMERRGDALTLAVGSNDQGAFKPYNHKTIADLKARAPFLTRIKSPFFVQAGGGTILGMRLIVNGKAGDAGPAPKAPAPVALLDQAPLSKLGGQQPVPAFLQDPGDIVADRDGIRKCVLRTVESGLNEKDFVADIQFRFAPNEQSILLIGLGGTGPGGLGWENAVYSRVHGPGYGGYATLALQGEGEKQLGTFVTPGPHVFRLEKRGDVLWMAIGDLHETTFKPYFQKAVLNVKSAASFLTPQNSTVFVQSTGASLAAVRFLVNGKRAEMRVARGTRPPTKTEPTPRTKPTTIAKTEPVASPKSTTEPPVEKESTLVVVPGAVGRENLIALTKGSLPTYLQSQRGVAFDAQGGVVLAKHNFRTGGADFIKKDFTFDVVFRFAAGEQAIAVIGIGPGGRDHNGAVIQNCVCSRVHGPGFGGYGTVTVSGQAERPLGKFTTVGPHLFRLQKRGNVLTMAVSIGFKDKFVADLEQSIPDLKSAAPFLNDQNSWLFFGNGGVVDAMRLVVDGEPIESRDVVLGLPPQTIEGKALALALKDPNARRFSLVSGPAGVTVTAAGQLAWTPTPEQLGRQQLRIGLTGGKETIAVVHSLDVVSAEDAQLVGGQLAKIDALYKLPLVTDKVQIVPGRDGKSLLVLDGKRLHRVVGNGVTVQQSHDLPAACERIAERADSFVALSDEKKSLLFIDKQTRAVRRTVPMDYFRRNDLAVHPTKPLVYVSVSAAKGGGNPVDVFVIVDEQTGDVHEPEGLAGTWLAISPDGKELYAGERHFYGSAGFDSLAAYTIRETVRPYLRQIKNDPGGNGRGIVLSPDGKRLSYLSYTGYPEHSKAIPAWDPSDLEKRPVTYACKDRGASCLWIAYHPQLELVAAPIEDGGAAVFRRETGAAQSNRVDLTYPSLGDAVVHKVHFAPDGRHLLLECEDDGVRYLRRARFRLTAAEVSQLRN